MKPIFKISILIIAVLAVIFACKRDKADFVGPGYISAPEGFAVISLNASAATVDFIASNTISFDASFTSEVSWILTLKGEKSGAYSEFRGTGGNFAGIVWKGNHDGVYFFRAGENVTATLSFYGTTYTYSLSYPIKIVTVPDFRTCGQFPKFADFEDTTRIKTPNWTRFNSPGAKQGMDSIAVDYNGNKVPPVQGRNYYYIKGLGTQPAFVDGLQYTGTLLPALPATPDNIWVNMFIYGTGDANASVDIEYQESDADGTSANYSGTDDDAFVAHITLGHKGWKLFSFQYSKLVPSANADFGGSGNKIHEPARLKSWDIVLLKKSNPDSPVEVYFDYPIITIGGPFKPCK